jgi:hypothetical protein
MLYFQTPNNHYAMTEHSTKEGEQERKVIDADLLREFNKLDLQLSKAREAYMKDEKPYREQSMWHLIQVRDEAIALIKKIGHPRFEPVETTCVHYPEINEFKLGTCPYCGNPNCQSDHK